VSCSYPYTNPYRQDHASSSSQLQQQHPEQLELQSQQQLQQQQQWWEGQHYSSQWQHPRQSRRGYSNMYPYSSSGYSWQQWYQWQQWQQHQHHEQQSCTATAAGQQVAGDNVHQELQLAVNGVRSEAEQDLHSEDADTVCEEEGEADDDLDLPTDDDDCDPRAVLLLSRLQITEAAAKAAEQAAAAAPGDGRQPPARAAPTTGHAKQHNQQQQQPQQCTAHGPGAHPLHLTSAASGAVCWSCWASSYAAWQRDYKSWRQQYSAWWYSMQGV
jgi:hypothetical protein